MVRLHEFIGKEYKLLLDFPLYSKISIETFIEEEEEVDTQYTNDGEFLGAWEITHFFENRDVVALKSIFSNKELIDFHFCPSCKKEVPIVYKSSKKLPDNIISSILVTDHITEQEQYQSNLDYAKNVTQARCKILRESFFEKGIFRLELNCTAKEQHKFNVIFMLDEKGFLTKIGQEPPIREFNNLSKRYESILIDTLNMKELNSSIELKSLGVGIGSLVYLRRIFERLIYEQYESFLKDNPDDNKKLFSKKPMHSKIEYLKEYLPPFLLEHKSTLYSILNTGIHQLSEEECLDNYDTVYAAIITILEEKLKYDEERKRQEELRKSIKKIHREIRN